MKYKKGGEQILIVCGETTLLGLRTGKKKSGDPWFLLKCLDLEGDTVFSLFITKEQYTALESLEKQTSLALTLNVIPNTRFCQVLSIEPIKVV